MESMLVKISLIAAGGALGAVARYGLSGITYGALGETFPSGTLVVNLAGCFAIGFLWALFELVPFSIGLNVFLFTGLLGGFTTFSTFGLETINLFRDGEIAHALMNVALSNVLGLGLVVAGFFAGRVVFEVMSRGTT